MTKYLDRNIAMAKILSHKGEDLHEHARILGSISLRDKGWPGKTVQKLVDAYPDPAVTVPVPENMEHVDYIDDIGPWELKTQTIFQYVKKPPTVQQTMSIMRINATDALLPFDESKLYMKMQFIVIPLCFRFRIVGLLLFDLNADTNRAIREQLLSDYEVIRKALDSDGYDSLKSEIGFYLHARTKGPGGKAPRRRGFYTRPKFVRLLLDREQIIVAAQD